MPVDEKTLRTPEKLFEIVNKRKDTFGKALIGFALSRNEAKELKVCFGRVHFLKKEDSTPEPVTYDYGNFILTKKSIEVEEAISLIRSVFESQVLILQSEEIPIKLQYLNMRSVYSYERWGNIFTEWPALYASAEIDITTRGVIPSGPLLRLGPPPHFPDGEVAIRAFFDLLLVGGKIEGIELLVPNYRARIKNLRLAGNRVTVEVETKAIAPKDVLAKFYCRSENKIYTSSDLPLEDGQVSFVTDEEPLQVEVAIISALDEEVIDMRKFYHGYPSEREGVIIENNEAQLLAIIDKGEGKNVEFKKELDKEEFLETVVAFANTDGGIIFLGVDDNCRVVGLKEDLKDKIINLIAEHCDPPIDVQVDSNVLVKGSPITLVKVPEGKNKPYILKGKGIFVRRGSSDRQIKRAELDDIYTERRYIPPSSL